MVRTLHLTLSFVRANSILIIANVAIDQTGSLTRLPEAKGFFEAGQQTQTEMLSQSHLKPDDERDLFQHEDVMNPNSTSTFTSIMTSSITTTLSSLSMLMPFSWGTTDCVVTTPMCIAPAASVPNMDNSVICHDQPQHLHRGFVSRRRQLKRLRERMETEGPWRMNHIAVLHCKNCLDRTVAL